MERVHGEHTIRRRKEYISKKSYRDYTEILKEDFHNLCGYCGKDLQDLSVFSAERQIDHFVPIKICKECGRADYIYKYENLVNSCRVCNRNKSDDWPTRSILESHDGTVGYIDPADDDYDNHLSRTDEGAIIPLTKVGEYMYRKLRFSVRPLDICWLMKNLVEKKEKIAYMIDESDIELYKKYFECDRILLKYVAIIKEAKESL